MTNVNLIPNGLFLRACEPISCEFKVDIDVRRYGKCHRKINKFIRTKKVPLIEDESIPGFYQTYELNWPKILIAYPTLTVKYWACGEKYSRKISLIDVILGEGGGQVYEESIITELCRKAYYETALEAGNNPVNYYITGLWLNLETGDLYLNVNNIK